MTLKVLIVEDSRDVAKVVAVGVRMTFPGCQVMVAADGTEAIQSFTADPPDLVILDVTLPPPDGFEICQHIRETSKVPILMLTVHDATIDKVRALDLGADDYLTKPFDHLELLARLRALVRRSSGAFSPSGQEIVIGDFSLDLTTHEVRLRGEPIQLTALEYRLLEELARHAGTVLPHQLLLDRVWGPSCVGDSHYLNVFVQRLRHKFGEHASYIQTEWGVGYRFVVPR